MDKYVISCTGLLNTAQRLGGNIETFRNKADKLQKTLSIASGGDHKFSDLSPAYTAQAVLDGSIARLGEICRAMKSAVFKFSEASAELSLRANLTAYYMQHSNSLSYETLMNTFHTAVLSTGSAVAGYELVKEELTNSGHSVDSLGTLPEDSSARESEYSNRKSYDTPREITETKDSEYAELCYLSYEALKSKNPRKAFVDMIRNSDYILSDSSLKNITIEQVRVIDLPSGLQCFILTEGDKAVVVFVGTNGDWGDYVADATLAASVTPIQTLEAREIINSLGEQYGEITVTGHSLGGHLATDVTLRTPHVSKCVAFDPPGRYDAAYQNTFNKDNVAKLKTYEAEGSVISAVGYETGDVERVEVKSNGNIITRNHSIKEIRNALHSKRGGGGSR